MSQNAVTALIVVGGVIAAVLLVPRVSRDAGREASQGFLEGIVDHGFDIVQKRAGTRLFGGSSL